MPYSLHHRDTSGEVQNIAFFMSVSVCPLAYLKNRVRTSQNFLCALPVAVARSASDSNGMSCTSGFVAVCDLSPLMAANALFVCCGAVEALRTVCFHSARSRRVNLSPRGVTGAKSANPGCPVLACFIVCLPYADTIGWVTGRASGL